MRQASTPNKSAAADAAKRISYVLISTARAPLMRVISRSFQQVSDYDKRLVLVTPNGPDVNTPITLEPLGGGRFRFVAPTGGGVVGEVVRFVEESGRRMRMYTGDSWTDRVEPR